MLAPEITNHISQALARLMQQYQQIPNNYIYYPLSGGSGIGVSAFDTLLISFVDELQILENAIFSLDAGRQLWNGSRTPAVGAQIDGIGALVGVARNGLSDQEYLTFIFGQIAEDNSNATSAVIGAIISLLFGVTSLILQPLYPAEIFFEVPTTATLPAAQFLAATYIVGAALGAGIALAYAATYNASAPFLFSSIANPNAGAGFGDKNNTALGGCFASLIYTNNLGA